MQPHSITIDRILLWTRSGHSPRRQQNNRCWITKPFNKRPDAIKTRSNKESQLKNIHTYKFFSFNPLLIILNRYFISIIICTVSESIVVHTRLFFFFSFLSTFNRTFARLLRIHLIAAFIYYICVWLGWLRETHYVFFFSVMCSLGFERIDDQLVCKDLHLRLFISTGIDILFIRRIFRLLRLIFICCKITAGIKTWHIFIVLYVNSKKITWTRRTTEAKKKYLI